MIMDDVKKAEFVQLEQDKAVAAVKDAKFSTERIGKILDVTLGATVELGRAKLTLENALGIDIGTVIELDKVAGEPVDFYINESLFARGEVVVIGDKYGIRITELSENSPIKDARK
jgi:flagellar motor switch protein FliN/FliY